MTFQFPRISENLVKIIYSSSPIVWHQTLHFMFQKLLHFQIMAINLKLTIVIKTLWLSFLTSTVDPPSTRVFLLLSRFLLIILHSKIAIDIDPSSFDGVNLKKFNSFNSLCNVGPPIPRFWSSLLHYDISSDWLFTVRWWPQT